MSNQKKNIGMEENIKMLVALFIEGGVSTFQASLLAVKSYPLFVVAASFVGEEDFGAFLNELRRGNFAAQAAISAVLKIAEQRAQAQAD